MIIGKRRRALSSDGWRTVYAILPKRLVCGRWAFLHWVERKSYWATDIPFGTPKSLFGYVYREPEEGA